MNQQLPVVCEPKICPQIDIAGHFVVWDNSSPEKCQWDNGFPMDMPAIWPKNGGDIKPCHWVPKAPFFMRRIDFTIVYFYLKYEK